MRVQSAAHRVMALCAAIVASVLIANAAFADEEPSAIGGIPTGADFWGSMRFSMGPPMPGGSQRIYGAGTFDENTVNAFKQFLASHRTGPGTVVALHSPGGDLRAGILVGALIRDNSFVTTVAQRDPNAGSGMLAEITANAPGVCASACSFAFLGGVERSIPEKSLYGVHDAYRETAKAGEDLYDLGQKTAGAISSYLNMMGISPDLLFLLTQFNSNQGQVLFMTQADMAKLNVTTHGGTSWGLENNHGVFALEGRNPASAQFPGIYERVVFACSGNPRRIVLGAFYMPEKPSTLGAVSSTSPGMFASMVSSYSLNVMYDGSVPGKNRFATLTVAPQDVRQRAKVTDAHHVAAFFALTPAQLHALAHSGILTVSFNQRFGLPGSVSVDLSRGRQQFNRFVQTCH